MKYPPTLAIVEATLAVTAWGGSFIASKIALDEISPVTLVWMRTTMGVAVLGLAAALRRQFILPGKRDLIYLAGLGLQGITFHQWLQSTGLQTSQASTTAWIVATTPIFMALLGWLVLKEKLRSSQALGIGLAALGVILVVTQGDLAALAAGRAGAPGDALILLGAPNWAIFSVLSRSGLQRFPATSMMFYVMGFGGLFTSFMFLAGAGFGEITGLSSSGWLGVVFLGIVCSGLAYLFWYDALQRLSVAQTGAFVYLEPFVAVILAALILDEPFRLTTLSGGMAILLGVWLVNHGPGYAEGSE